MLAQPHRADLPGMPPSGRTVRIRPWRREDAQTMAEYVVVLAVITPIVILSFGSLSSAVLSAIGAASAFL
jgi:Flp pilus assembly pilin Flp